MQFDFCGQEAEIGKNLVKVYTNYSTTKMKENKNQLPGK
jgi:hypothetical protein